MTTTYCGTCGNRLDVPTCPRCDLDLAKRAPVDIGPLPRAHAVRRLAGSGIEYLAYSVTVKVMLAISALSLGTLDALIVPFLVLMIALRDVRSGLFSLGKRVAHMRVVQIGSGLPATNRQAVLRNSYYLVLVILMAFPLLPVDLGVASLFYSCVVIDVLMIVATRSGRRLGDLLARTQVVSQAEAA
jgi:uncharacterized RDD family membrane protein YckC